MKNIHIVQLPALLALLTLFAACAMIDEPLPPKPAASEDGVTLVRVSIGGNARTILPDFGWNFSKYVLSVEPAGSNSQSAPEPVEIGGSEGQIGVPYGEWIVTATAYVNVSGTDYAAAKGSAPMEVWEWQEEWERRVTIAVNAPETGGIGTFAWSTAYPADASAHIKLEAFPPGNGTAVIDAEVTGSSEQEVPSGVYFLTVSATANAKTITRNEVVHIYSHLTTNADYVFTKLDFGADNLEIGGTIQVLVDGVQPDYANLSYSFSFSRNDWYGFSPINFNGANGNGTWSISLSNLQGANTIYFWAEVQNGLVYKPVAAIPVPLDDTYDIDLGSVTITTIPLSEEEWFDGSITTAYDEAVYTINVSAGTNYFLWWNHVWDGDDTKTAAIEVRARYDNGNQIDGWGNGWNDPVSFTANSSGTVYIRVANWGEIGTYAIAYSTDSHWWNNSFNPVNVVPLNADTWVDDEIFIDSDDWYEIDVTEGTDYHFWWNQNQDWGGNGEKTASIEVYAYYGNGVQINGWGGNAWNDPRSFTANSNGKVYIRVQAYNYDYNPGTYAIAYSTSRFGLITPEQLPADTWFDGVISIDTYNWYEIDVTEGTDYHFWWNQNQDWGGNGEKTAYINVWFWYDNGESIGGWSNAWNDPVSFTANSTAKVYIRVQAYDYGYNPGTYAIAYSTSRFGLITPEQLLADTWFDGEISIGAYDWYSIDVTEGQTYYLWWNDSYSGDDTKTVDVYVEIYNDNGESIGWWDNAWNDPVSFTADISGRVFLRVRSYDDQPGTYAIVYSENDTRPD